MDDSRALPWLARAIPGRPLSVRLPALGGESEELTEIIAQVS